MHRADVEHRLPGWGWGDGELEFNGDRVSVWDDEKVPNGWWWFLHNIVNVFNVTE